MRLMFWKQLTGAEQAAALKRPAQQRSENLTNKTSELIDWVRRDGDKACLAATERYDHVTLETLRVSEAEFQTAEAQLSESSWKALELAKDNIERFHRQQMPRRYELPTLAGVRCYREIRALESVGFYVPGGSAPLPSTVLMLGVPSLIAGNPVRALCTPPQKDGTVHPAVLAAARLCGIEQIYKLGGAQAIAAMAYGTESVPKVQKIFGPGNTWVTEAKMQVSVDPEGAAIDMPAGPSEVLVIADESANPEFVAADLLSQAEHGPDSQVILLCTSEAIGHQVLAAIDKQLLTLPRREIAIQALRESRCLVVDKLSTALTISNSYAPEHLILQILEPEVWARSVQNAGSVFLGPWSPEAAGDYASGTNHVLPTYGYARSVSGLSVEAFIKHITFQHLSRDGLAALAPSIENLASLEGLEGHRRAVSLRLEAEKKQ